MEETRTIVSIDLGIGNTGVTIYDPLSGELNFRLLRCNTESTPTTIWEWGRVLTTTLALDDPWTKVIIETPFISLRPGTGMISLQLHCLYSAIAALCPETHINSRRHAVIGWAKTLAPDLTWVGDYGKRKKSAVVLASRLIQTFGTNQQKLAWARCASQYAKMDDVADSFLNLLHYVTPAVLWGKDPLVSDIVETLGFERLSLSSPPHQAKKSRLTRVPPLKRRKAQQAILVREAGIATTGTKSSGVRRQPLRTCRKRAKPLPVESESEDGSEFEP